MKIRTKLNCNMLLTSVGILLIAGFSLSGMKFVQGKLHVLTERSTPYQLKTIALQRALQEHTANLLKITSVTSDAELATLREEAGKSLKEAQQLSGEVAAFKGEAGESSKLKELEKVTDDMIKTTGERLKAEAAGRAAEKLINEKLARIAASLDKAALTIKGTQKKSVGELSSSNDSVKRSSLKMTMTQNVASSVNELRLAVLEIAAAEQKSGVESAQARLNAAGQAITKSPFMRTDKNTPHGKEVSSGIADVTKLVTGPGGIVESKSALLANKADEAAKQKLSQDVNAAIQRIAKMSAALTEFAAKINEQSKEEGKKFDRTLEDSVILTDHLSANSDLTELGSSLNGMVKEYFLVRSLDELSRLKERTRQSVAKAQKLIATRLKSIAGIGSVSRALTEINDALLSKDGVADKIQNIIKVNQEVAALNGTLKTLVAEQRKQGEAGMSSARTDQENAIKAVNTMFRSSIVSVFAIGLGVLVFMIIASIMLGRSITRPIAELSTLAERFGSGDFNARMDENRKDEFGVLAGHFNSASERLKEIVTDLTTAIRRLGESSQELTSISARLTDGAMEQKGQAAQSATALEEMSRTISEVAHNANEAAIATRDASKEAKNGKDTVAAAVASMEQIAAAVGETAQTIQKLGASSAEIGNIVSVINDIADQTNLLALNAAIEAARAGEMGKGFAVVADEVRNLAQRTTDATKEIAGMIQEIQANTERSIVMMHKGQERVADGVELATKASDALESIVAASDKGAAMVIQIATAAEEQAAVAYEATAGVERMAELSNVTDSDSHNVNQNAQELSTIASELGSKAAWFKV